MAAPESPPPSLARLAPFWLPPALTGAAVLAIVVLRSVTALALPQPATPWAAAQLVEGWRAAEGLPVHEPVATGHATHMYGILWSPAVGLVLRATGPVPWALPLLALACVAALVALLVIVLTKGRPRWVAAFAVVLLAGVDNHAAGTIAEGRPDTLALLLSGLALVALYRGARADRLAWTAGGAGLLTIAFLVKQTSAMFALVPLLPLVLERTMPARRRAVHAALPWSGLLLSAGAVRLLAPAAFDYMCRLPARYRLRHSPEFFGESLVYVAQVAAFLAVFMAWWLWQERGKPRAGPLHVWTLSAMLVAAAGSALSFAKVGGHPNSWLPALLALAVFVTVRLEAFVTSLHALCTTPGRRLLGGIGLALLVLVMAGPLDVIEREPWHDRAEVMAALPALEGKAICPEDPSLTLEALGRIDRSWYLERDASPLDGRWPTNWPRQLPEHLQDELARARHVVDVRDYQLLDGGFLSGEGFHLTASHEHHAVWSRTSP